MSGFGAAFALLLTNVDALSGHIELEALRSGIRLFLWAVAAGVAARYLGAIVMAGAAAASEGAALGKELSDANIEVNVGTMFREAEKAVFWPVRLLVASSFRKVESGDLAAGGRMHSKLVQVQGICVVAEVILVIASAGFLASGLTV